MYDIGWNHPLSRKSAGHKIPFCSHCHLLVPSRFEDKSGREGRARNHGLRPRSLDKLAKPLRWFQLKLAVLPVGFINSELAQTLTSMGGTFSPWPHYPEAPFVWLPRFSSLHLILCFSFTFYYRELQLGLSNIWTQLKIPKFHHVWCF